MMRSSYKARPKNRVTPLARTRIRVTERMSPVSRLPPPPPHSAPIPTEEVQVGRRLTEALVTLAAEHAREHSDSIAPARRDAVTISALVAALGAISAAVARASGFDLTQYEEFLTAYVARVFQVEATRPVYH